jgi:hypothetical protein
MGSKLRLSATVLTVLICGSFFANSEAQTQIQPGQVLISELRLAGEAGVEDEFIEIYNNTNSDIFVQATDTTPGWAVAVSFGQVTGTLFIIPNGTRIPARGHYLGANINGYSLSGYPSGNPIIVNAKAPNGIFPAFANTTPDATWDFGIPENDLSLGLALFSTTNGTSWNVSTRLDAFGMVDAAALFREGAGYPTAPLGRTLVRDMRTPTGIPKDTDNNAADFLLLSDGGRTGTVGPGELLGAPGPENLNSPVTNVYPMKASLLDPIAGSNNSPNRERRPNVEPNADLGVLLIRRRITNNSSSMISRLRFRVIDVTGPGSDNTCGASLCADVRVLSSQDGEAGSPNIGVVTVRGLTLEQPPVQPNGGGFNSSLSADFINLTTPLAPGASANVEFKLGVMRTGTFRLLVNFESQALPVPNQPETVILRMSQKKGISK